MEDSPFEKIVTPQQTENLCNQQVHYYLQDIGPCPCHESHESNPHCPVLFL